MTTNYRKVYPTSAVAPQFYGLPKIHKVVPLGPLFLVGGPSHMGWPRSWPTLFALWLVNSHIISTIPTIPQFTGPTYTIHHRGTKPSRSTNLS